MRKCKKRCKAIFELFDDAAKNYIIQDGDTILGKGVGYIRIETAEKPYEELMDKLSEYGKSCVVLAPGDFRKHYFCIREDGTGYNYLMRFLF